MSNRKRRNAFRFLKRKFPKMMQKKLAILFVCVVLAFTILVGRITYINASSGDKYTKKVLDQQQYDSRVIPYKRGDITDANGTKLATSERVYNVILDLKVMLSKKENVEPTIKVLVDCFGIEESVVRQLIEEKPKSRYNILLKGISYDKAKEFETINENDKEYPNIEGIWLEDDYVRTYPYNTLASDLIGFTSAGNVGSVGLERYYNEVLNGVDGREYGYLEKDSSLERTVKEAQNGNTVVTTIDANLQRIVESQILQFNEEHQNEATQGMGSKNTAVMIMNPNTGAILAEASYPNYDLNNPRDLSGYFSTEEIEAMNDEQSLEELNKIWKNFCVSDTFEPGSTMKPFTVALGLETGKLSGNESYYCGGSLHVGDHDIHCHNRSGHGMQTVEEAIANSCNVALMQMAETIGNEDFCKYQRIFGFGQYTGIDLPGEALTAGLLYTAESMGAADLATNSFGQNFNVTMTQLTAGFCSLINGGNYYEPHVVSQIKDESGSVIENIEPVLRKKTISEKTSTVVKKYMKAVLDYGTGSTAQVEGYDIGGKTGTAEKLPRGQGNYVLSFIGYAPQENPEVVIYVVIDEPNVDNQSASSYVTQLSANIMAEVFPYLNITMIDGYTPSIQPVTAQESSTNENEEAYEQSYDDEDNSYAEIQNSRESTTDLVE
ncbi:peptidoglycan D,D-transpeptidase FtsI family protein [Lachnospiraceae bacterium LCP25S3_G4]